MHRTTPPLTSSLRSHAARAFLALSIVASNASAALAQTPAPPPALPNFDLAQALLDRMSAQQRVGQLFIISFPGTDVGPNSDIAKLITDYHIGGVQLKASAQNFSNDADDLAAAQIKQLVRDLQTIAVKGTTNVPPTPDPDAVATPTRTPRPSAATITPTIRLSVDPRSIPLFIGIAQDNDLSGPIDLPELRSGARQSPNAMTLGATWDPDNAAAIGAITGGDLSRMGVNLYFGPSLDVMDTPRPGTPGDLGTRVFGGDPLWVGRFGVSFIEGIRAGSGGRLAADPTGGPTRVRHGGGDADRSVGAVADGRECQVVARACAVGAGRLRLHPRLT